MPNNIFETNQVVNVPRRNLFDLSVENLVTANIGYLYPVFVDHLMPGDKFQLSPSAIIKTAPFVNPIYGQINVDFHCFVVPYRLLWDKWSDWIYDTSKTDLLPHMDLKTILEESTNINYQTRSRDTYYGTLADFLGYNYATDLSSNIEFETMTHSFEVNILPFLAYHQIYNENFRDEDLILPLDWLKEYNRLSDWNQLLASGDVDSLDFFALHRRAYRKDYFTSARPWPQKGTVPSMGVTLQGQVPVMVNLPEQVQQSYHNFLLLGLRGQGGTSTTTFAAGNYDISSENTSLNPNATPGTNAVFTNTPEDIKVYADLSQGNINAYFNIQQFRNMFAIQRWFEINAVSGSRYIEGTRAYWGVSVKDSRAQIPEFLGYQTTVIQLSEVLQHDQQTGSAPRGTRSAVGNAATFGKPWRYYATENSIVMVLMSIRPTTNYSQGISRKLRMLTQFDLPFPQFQQLGEQEIKNSELYCDLTLPTVDDEFGYQSRYSEWRSSFNEVHGEFRGTLRDWTLFRKFTVQPPLSQNFIEIGSDFMPNIFPTNDDTVDNFMCDLYFKFKVLRPLKYHSMPAIIG